MTLVVLVVAAVGLAAAYVTWTAGRLDRLHARVDAAWAALDAQLARRAAAARSVAALLPGAAAAELEAATAQALEATGAGRDAAENRLTRALRAALSALPPGAQGPELAELAACASRVGLARAVHNAAVQDTRAIRRRVLPRALRLAGRRAMPEFFEIDDTVLS